MVMKEFSLGKQERLSAKKVIDKLFIEGNTFFAYPFKIVFLRTELPCSSPVQAAFTVSKKNFKRAVKRNYLKRRMREAYRINKSIIYKLHPDPALAVMFIYTGKQIEEYSTIEDGMIRSLRKLAKTITKKGLPPTDEKPL